MDLGLCQSMVALKINDWRDENTIADAADDSYYGIIYLNSNLFIRFWGKTPLISLQW